MEQQSGHLGRTNFERILKDFGEDFEEDFEGFWRGFWRRQTNDWSSKVAIWEEPILRSCQFEPSPLFALTSPAFVEKYLVEK